jgi:hypothetical protein
MDCLSLDSLKSLRDLREELKSNPELLFYKTIHPNQILRNTYFWCQMAYQRYNSAHTYLFSDEKKCPYELITCKYFRNSPYIIIVIKKEWKKIIIGIRGTFRLRDLVSIAQLNNKKKRLLPTNISNIALPDELDTLYDNVHPGVVNHANIVYSMILSTLNKHPNKEDFTKYNIYVHGHSLGAACSILISHYLSKIGYKNIYCNCLSCPAFFNPKFKLSGFNYTHYYTQGDLYGESIISLLPRWNIYNKKSTKTHILKLPDLDDKLVINKFSKNFLAHSVFMDKYHKCIYVHEKYKKYINICPEDHNALINMKKVSYKPINKKIRIRVINGLDKMFSSMVTIFT